MGYPNHARCTWQISINRTNEIVLTFIDFDLEEGYDFLTIYDDSNNTIERFTGSISQNFTMPLSVSIATLHFTSDQFDNNRGFRIILHEVEGPSSTEIVSLEMDSASSLPTARNDYSKTSSPITLESYGDGIMKSPNYPNSYSNDADCRWQMHRKSNQSLFLIIILLYIIF